MTRPAELPGADGAPRLLHEIFWRAAEATPDAVALELPPGPDRPHRQRRTYGEIAARARCLAVALHEGALGPGTRRDAVVGILLPRETLDLYVAQLAIMAAGAAYTCLDPRLPDERLRFIIEDADVACVLTDAAGLARVGARGVSLEAWTPTDAQRAAPLPAPPWAGPEALAYVIYTSGTTGQPKGVLIEHRGAVNLALSDVDYFHLGPHDRVGQSSSVAYDSSVEETYLAFGVSATLVVIDDATARLGPDLVPWLRRERLTVLAPPPTLLRSSGCADPQAALPELRLLYVGGEALPPDVAEAWAAGRWMENGYGPTECTVTVTRGRVVPGAPVDIGRAVRGNTAHVLDAHLQPVPDGQAGELCVAGVGLARGYLGRSALTAQRFPTHPQLGRLYRTGDRVRRLPSGALEYLGRVDAQVKIRGYRVELEDIEAHLARCPGVRAAACAVQGPEGRRQLVAFLVAEGEPDQADIRDRLRAALPDYMVPALFGRLGALPTQAASGKLDRAALPTLTGRAPRPTGRRRPPRTPHEAAVVEAFERVLDLPGSVSVDEDFFTIGGDSLRAAQAISLLRQTPDTAGLTVRDLYDGPTAERMAARLTGPAVDSRRAHRDATDVGRPGWVTLAQAAFIAAELLVGAQLLYWLGFRLLPWLLLTVGLIPTLLLSPPAMFLGRLAWLPLGVLLARGWKRLLIGRYTPGRHPLWGGFYLRNWLVGQLVRGLPFGLVEGTVFKNWCFNLLGARIAGDAHLHAGVDLAAGGWDLLTVEAGASVGRDAALRLVEVVDRSVVVAPVHIEAGATVDTRAGLGGHVRLGAGAFVGPLSMVPAGTRVPARERWEGVPAQAVGPAAPPPPVNLDEPTWSPVGAGLRLIAGRLLLSTLTAIPLWGAALGAIVAFDLDAAEVVDWLYRPGTSASTLLMILGLLTSTLFITVWMSALLSRLLPPVRPGVCSRWGRNFLRAWLKAGLLETAGNWLSGTLMWPLWLRLAGMKIGPGCEVSTITDVSAELITLGPRCFFADGIYLGGPIIQGGVARFGETRFGADSFVGNHVVVPPGARLPSDILLGICTVADEARVRPGTSWFGHPAFELPRREVVEVDRRLTHAPPLHRRLTRWIWELARFGLPVVPTLLSLAVFKTLLTWAPEQSPARFLLITVPAYGIAVSLTLLASVWGLKWALLGRVKPGQHALWSCWASRWDFLYVAWGAWAGPVTAAFEGTLMLAWWLRAVGVQVGRRVYLGGGSGQVVDPDMLHFEDHTTVTNMFQAHSFEDRVLKIDHVHIRAGATAGSNAVLMYGAELGAGCHVGEHSVVMKAERLSAGHYYLGCPTRPAAPPDLQGPKAAATMEDKRAAEA